MSISLIIVFTILIVVVSWWYIQRRKFVTCLKSIPGPPPLPIIGNALSLSSTKDVLPTLMKYTREYGGIVKLHIGAFPNMLIVSDHKLLEFLLTSTKLINKSGEYRFFMKWLGTGLLLSDGDAKWKKHRNIITPTFHLQILEHFVKIFQSQAMVLVEKLKNAVGEPSVNMSHYIHLCTLDIICETAMGTTMNAQENPNSPYVDSVTEMCRIFLARMFNPLLQTTIPYIFTEKYRTENKCIKTLHEYTNSVIEQKNKERINTRKTASTMNQNFGKTKKRLALLDLLLEEKERDPTLTDEHVREEVDTFMFAGHDTTAAALGFTLYCLAENPDVQQAVVNEILEVFGNDSLPNFTIKDLNSMKYLEAVIKESLRLYPPVVGYGRKVQEDTEYGDVTLPKGLSIVAFAYGIHRNPELYSDPEKFNPERFLSENSTAKLPFSYIPFSVGPRNCIGQKFAMLELKSVLTSLLRHYEVHPAYPKQDLVLLSEIVLKPLNGIRLQLQERCL